MSQNMVLTQRCTFVFSYIYSTNSECPKMWAHLKISAKVVVKQRKLDVLSWRNCSFDLLLSSWHLWAPACLQVQLKMHLRVWALTKHIKHKSGKEIKLYAQLGSSWIDSMVLMPTNLSATFNWLLSVQMKFIFDGSSHLRTWHLMLKCKLPKYGIAHEFKCCFSQ